MGLITILLKDAIDEDAKKEKTGRSFLMKLIALLVIYGNFDFILVVIIN